MTWSWRPGLGNVDVRLVCTLIIISPPSNLLRLSLLYNLVLPIVTFFKLLFLASWWLSPLSPCHFSRLCLNLYSLSFEVWKLYFQTWMFICTLAKDSLSSLWALIVTLLFVNTSLGILVAKWRLLFLKESHTAVSAQHLISPSLYLGLTLCLCVCGIVFPSVGSAAVSERCALSV